MRSQAALLGLIVVLALIVVWVYLPTAEELTSVHDTPEPTSESATANTMKTELVESRESVPLDARSTAKPVAPLAPGEATLDLVILGLPRHDAPWLTVSRIGRVATPNGSVERRFVLDTSVAHSFEISRHWAASSPRFFFPNQSTGLIRLSPGEHRRVTFDFNTLSVVHGRLIGSHGIANTLIAAQLLLPTEKWYHFSVASNEHGEFTVRGLPQGTLFLFHHGSFPPVGLGPKLLDSKGNDRWQLPVIQTLEVQTSDPLLGVLFVENGTPINTDPPGPGNINLRHEITASTGIYRNALEHYRQEKLTFKAAGHGRFERRWRELKIDGEHRFLVPVPDRGGLTGSLRIAPASKEEEKLRRKVLAGKASREWRLGILSRVGKKMLSLPRYGKEDRWTLPKIAAGEHTLFWTRGNVFVCEVDQPAFVRAGAETVVRLAPPKLKPQVVRIVNWDEIPTARRPHRVMPSCAPGNTFSAEGHAKLNLPIPLPRNLQFELSWNGSGGFVTARIVSRANGIDLEYPTTLRPHRLRVRPRLGGTTVARAAIVRTRHGRSDRHLSYSHSRRDGWCSIYADPGKSIGVWIMESFHNGSRTDRAVRGWVRLTDPPRDWQLDPGGRVLQVELETHPSTISVEITGLPAEALSSLHMRQKITADCRLWLPEGTASIHVQIGNQGPVRFPVKELKSPFVIKR